MAMKVAEQQISNNNVMGERWLGLSVTWRRVVFYLTLGLGFFLLGFVPMWLKTSQTIEQRDAAQREVRLSQLQNTLGSAIADVRQGDYEPARQIMSDFYTNLRSQLDAGNRSVFTPTQRERLRPLVAERDEVITLLARSDPAAEERLFAIYSSYSKLTSNGV
jgi:hypothetical protein